MTTAAQTDMTEAPEKPKSGVWKHVQPEEILAYRKNNGISRAKLATTLGVSATSVQNWEGGRVAAIPTQRRLRSLIDGDPLPAKRSSKDDPDERLCVVTVTGQIVAAYLASQENVVNPDRLTELIRSVKDALRD
ncbi:MAG: helix-turn-helix domain-containing protein [Planctomycetes bacterium]|nr:helix-turn-helix domain-containing protein [Planctomycetota bacterium]